MEYNDGLRLDFESIKNYGMDVVLKETAGAGATGTIVSGIIKKVGHSSLTIRPVCDDLPDVIIPFYNISRILI